jgi:hypothetical protein
MKLGLRCFFTQLCTRPFFICYFKLLNPLFLEMQKSKLVACLNESKLGFLVEEGGDGLEA